MRIAWDHSKDLANQRKHGLSFREARKLFAPGNDYLEIFDEAHSELDDRFIAIGPISRGIILVVFAERDEDTIRIISARWATRREQVLYHSYLDDRS